MSHASWIPITPQRVTSVSVCTIFLHKKNKQRNLSFTSRVLSMMCVFRRRGCNGAQRSWFGPRRRCAIQLALRRSRVFPLFSGPSGEITDSTLLLLQPPGATGLQNYSTDGFSRFRMRPAPLPLLPPPPSTWKAILVSRCRILFYSKKKKKKARPR